MAQFATQPPRQKFKKPLEEEWKDFSKGLNLLFRPTELNNKELAVADNIMLEGSGVPTGRWGTSLYFAAGATGTIRGFATFVSNDEATNDILALTDQGYMQKKNGSSSTVVTGQSWPSGSIIHSEQLGQKTYIVSEDVPFTTYDGTNLAAYPTISAPTGLYATNYSGVSGPNTESYVVVAIDANGNHTGPSTNYVLANLPQDLTRTQVNLLWSAPSAASLSGYEIYRGVQGDERLLSTVGPTPTQYTDNGSATSSTILAPLVNTTGGVKSKFIKKYKDRLLVVNADEPNKLMISGRYPYHTSFSWIYGGGYIYIDPDSGDNITGIAVQPIADRIVIYKNRSSYLVELKTVTVGNFTFLDPDYVPISTEVGCSNQDTIFTVENDTFYFGRNGLYVTGYEPNFLNIIRTNEISARIRPYLANLNGEDYATACAFYVDKKYILSIPRLKEMMVYDRERGCWLGPWKLPFGISHLRRYIDGNGDEKWVLGSYEDNNVYIFDVGTNNDNGEIIIKTMRTKKSYYGDFTSLNIITFFYFLFKGITGSVTVNLIGENRDGTQSIVKTFTLSGSATSGFTGWGADSWGSAQWGTSNETTVNFSPEEAPSWGTVFKQVRWVQMEITATEPGSNFEFLWAKIKAQKQGEGTLSSSQRV